MTKPKKIYTLKRTPIKLSQKSIDKMLKKRLEKAKSQSSTKKPIIYKKPSNPVKTKIKQVSKKQSSINKALSEVKRQITQEALDSDMYYCRGCGCSSTGLDKSHLINISQRPDLQLVKEIITLHCRSCHIIYESGDISKISKMLDFSDNLAILKKYDEEFYQKMVQKLENP